VPVALEKKTRGPSVQVRAEFVAERRQDRDIPVRLTLRPCDVNLRRVAVQQQILDPDVHKLINAGAGLKQRLDQQTVLAFVPVCRLNQTLDFGPVKPLHRSFPGSRRFETEKAAGRTSSGHTRDGVSARGGTFPE
jgi:hypothetical protein